jgi:hypothetical protein
MDENTSRWFTSRLRDNQGSNLAPLLECWVNTNNRFFCTGTAHQYIRTAPPYLVVTVTRRTRLPWLKGSFEETLKFSCRKFTMKSYTQIMLCLHNHKPFTKTVWSRGVTNQKLRSSKNRWYIFVKTRPSGLSSFSPACRWTDRIDEANIGKFVSFWCERTWVRLMHYIVSSTKPT